MGAPSLLDLPGYDTWLARALLDQELLDVVTLRGLLGAARDERGAQGLTLARLVRDQALVEEPLLEDLLRRFASTAEEPRGSPAKRFGDHRVLQTLGSGGMGVVYRVEHEPTGAQRALKTLSACDAEAVLRFRREAEAMARVDRHRNVVRIHDLGQEGNELYLIMDIAQGGSLAERLTSGPLAPEEAASVVTALARGLEHVHGHGILHRDLKPANVLFDEHGNPQLVDFGLAKLAWEGSLTASGALMGTPVYMPPEQVLDSASIDERSDVYGLGAILYEALTGAAPFAPAAMLVTLTAVLEEVPTRPSALNPAVPEWLDALCLRCLEKRPAKRPPSASALAELLSAGPQDTPTPARLPWVLASLLVPALLVGALLLNGETPTPPTSQPTEATSSPEGVDSAATEEADHPAPATTWPVEWDPLGRWSAKQKTLYVRALTRPRLERFALLAQLAPYGEPRTLRHMAEGHLSGELERDYPQGVALLQRAVKHGGRGAAGILASICLRGEGDRESASYWLDYARIGEALDLPTDERLGVALAHLGANSDEPRTARSCKLALDACRERGAWAPSGAPAVADAEAYEVIRQALEPPSDHWPSALPNWPFSTSLRFTPAEQATFTAVHKGRPPAASERKAALYLALARRDHPQALRARALRVLRGLERPKRPAGLALHLLWRAVEHGSVAAAGELAQIYMPRELEPPLVLEPCVKLKQTLGFGADLKLTVAALTIASSDPENGAPYGSILPKALALLPPGDPGPTLAQAYRYLEERWKPPAAVLAQQRVLLQLDRWLAEQARATPELEAKLRRFEEEQDLAVLERLGAHHQDALARSQDPAAAALMLGAWRAAMKAGHDDSQFRLIQALTERLGPPLPAPAAPLRRWLLRLAERGQWRAARLLAQHSVNPLAAASDPLLPKDPSAAVAWIRIAESLKAPEGALKSIRRLVREAGGRPVALEPGAAWKLVRSRWPADAE